MARKAGPPIFIPELFRNAFLAGLGAVSFGAEEAQKTYERLVKRGELTQKDWERRLEELRGRISRKGLEKTYRELRTRILESSGDIRDRAKEARTSARKRIQKSLHTVGLSPEKPQVKAVP